MDHSPKQHPAHTTRSAPANPGDLPGGGPHELLVVVDRERTASVLTATAHRLLGYPLEKLRRGFLYFSVHPDDRDRARRALGEVLGKPGALVTAEFRMLHADGSYHTFEWVGRNLLHDESVGSIVISARDITARKEMEQGLRDREEAEHRFGQRLRQLVEVGNRLARAEDVDDLLKQTVQLGREMLGFARLGIWLTTDDPDTVRGSYGIDEAGRLRDERGVELQLTPGGPMEEIARGLQRVVLRPRAAIRNGAGHQIAEGSVARAAIWDGEKVVGILCTDDLLSGAPLTDADAEVLALYAATVGHLYSRKRMEEERRALEQRMSHAQRLESIGRLAGGVAHDFNNLLTAIFGFLELAEAQLPPGSPVADNLRGIALAAERAADLTRQLLAFARKQVIEPRIVDVNELVRRIEKMLRRVIGEDIDLVTRLSAEGALTKVDPGQLEQVLINLVANARDAMPDGGSLTIETATVQLRTPSEYPTGTVPPGDYIRVRVADTGHGMTPDVLERIFEPFFTTKEAGRGTGLGLAMCYGIIRQNEGYITARSTPGSGTTFDLFLPWLQGATVDEAPRKGRVRETRGTETVLVAEDEEMVRQIIVETLEERGYHVLEAANGREALTLLGSLSGDLHLLITDMVMPQMSGKELIEQVRAARPHTPVICISGYAARLTSGTSELGPNVALLPKPFTPADLANKVREVLDRPAQNRRP